MGDILSQMGQGVLQKAAGTGGAFVVHHEFPDGAALIQGNDLGILTADIHQGPDGRVQGVDAPAVASDFRHHLVGEIHGHPAVAGAHEEIHRLEAAAAQEGLPQLPGAFPGAPARGDQQAVHHPGAVVKHSLGGHGAGIDA